MKIKILPLAVLFSLCMLTACDDTTEDIGTSLLQDMDNLDVSTDTFLVTSQSIVADSVYSRTTTGYLGTIRDPETNVYITGNFMTQFHVQESNDELFPSADSIASKLDGQLIADSCELRLFYTNFFGDSLATMKMTVHEMQQPMLEDRNYYSNFDPIANGYIRTDGIHQDKVYTLTDLSIDESVRYGDSYTSNILVKLNNPYTDRNGNTYNNYGSYLLNAYYENPASFSNSLRFMKDVTPGFYFESTGGVGSMAYIMLSKLTVYFRYYETADSIVDGVVSFAGTEEVLQTTNVINDKQAIAELASADTCTYLKTPAGIFTELTLPVDDILRGHENDSLNTAKIVIPRINDSTSGQYNLSPPATLLMIPKDSLYTFFENNATVNNRTSFIASSSLSSDNSYTFNNVANMITAMNHNRASDDWNKVVIIPVEIDSNSSKISHNMSLTSTKLVGGSANPYDPIRVSVIYSKFK